MDINTTSKFPNAIDPLSFFKDIDFEDIPHVQEFRTLIAQGNLLEAQNYLIEHEINSFHADLYNRIENRIYTLQKFIQENKIKLTAYGSETPTGCELHAIWISG